MTTGHVQPIGKSEEMRGILGSASTSRSEDEDYSLARQLVACAYSDDSTIVPKEEDVLAEFCRLAGATVRGKRYVFNILCREPRSLTQPPSPPMPSGHHSHHCHHSHHHHPHHHVGNGDAAVAKFFAQRARVSHVFSNSPMTSSEFDGRVMALANAAVAQVLADSSMEFDRKRKALSAIYSQSPMTSSTYDSLVLQIAGPEMQRILAARHIDFDTRRAMLSYVYSNSPMTSSVYEAYVRQLAHQELSGMPR